VGLVEGLWKICFPSQQDFFCVVHRNFYTEKQVAVVVGEVRFSVLAAGLVGADELVVDV
jgi:hypothetical protein